MTHGVLYINTSAGKNKTNWAVDHSNHVTGKKAENIYFVSTSSYIWPIMAEDKQLLHHLIVIKICSKLH